MPNFFGDQIKALDDLAIKSRRQGYSLGKLLSAVQPTDIPSIASEIDFIFSTIFQATSPLESSVRHTPSRQIYKRFIVKDERKCAQ